MAKRGRGRPKGSRNKKTLMKMVQARRTEKSRSWLDAAIIGMKNFLKSPWSK